MTKQNSDNREEVSTMMMTAATKVMVIIQRFRKSKLEFVLILILMQANILCPNSPMLVIM